MDPNPQVSIIVPVYKAEKHIHKCIDSIRNQTTTDFELLLIDDGSPDECGKICDDYVNKDSRIRVFHKENGGVSSARNLGLKHSKGNFIAFIDSDDYIEATYLENMLKHMTDNVDLVICNEKNFYNSDKVVIRQYNESLLSAENFETLFTKYDLHKRTNPWGRLYRANKCTDLTFNENMHIGEDALFLYSYILKCQNIYHTNDADYIYMVDSAGSLTKRINSFQSELTSFVNISKIIDEIILKYNISDSKALKSFNSALNGYRRRLLTALYHDSSISKQQRINELKALDFSTIDEVENKASLKDKLLSSLLKKRLFKVYDIIRSTKALLNK